MGVDYSIDEMRDYKTEINIVQNIKSETTVSFTRVETFIDDDLNISHGNNSEQYINIAINDMPKTIKNMSPGKYEIQIKNPEYNLEDIELKNNDKEIKIIEEDGKYFLIIEYVPKDLFGIIDIKLTKNDIFYQATQKLNNFFIITSNKMKYETNDLKLFNVAADEPEPDNDTINELNIEDSLNDGIEEQNEEMIEKIIEEMNLFECQ